MTQSEMTPGKIKMKILPLLLLCIISQLSFGQKDDYTKSNEYYEKGNTSYLENDFKKAIEFYSLSLEKIPTIEAYYNRALSFFKLSDSCNYCRDFHNAAILGDTKSEDIYNKKCLISDTLYTAPDSIREEYPGYSYTLITKAICSVDTSVSYHDASNEKIKSIYLQVPQYPGGEKAMFTLIRNNLRYPGLALESGIQGTVFLTFIVEKSGEVSDIKVLRGIGGGCNEEAKRVIGLMQEWKPGKWKGIPVRVQYNIPLKFTLQ
jgi:TonB family protein